MMSAVRVQEQTTDIAIALDSRNRALPLNTNTDRSFISLVVLIAKQFSDKSSPYSQTKIVIYLIESIPEGVYLEIAHLSSATTVTKVEKTSFLRNCVSGWNVRLRKAYE